MRQNAFSVYVEEMRQNYKRNDLYNFEKILNNDFVCN